MYSDFMVSLMQMMEPRFMLTNTIIFHELDEVTEVLFFKNGSFDLGFELNGKHQYVLRYVNSAVPNEKNAGEAIGEYGCSLNKTSPFIIKAASFCDGFYIRKLYWSELLTEHAFVTKSYIQKVTVRH